MVCTGTHACKTLSKASPPPSPMSAAATLNRHQRSISHDSASSLHMSSAAARWALVRMHFLEFPRAARLQSRRQWYQTVALASAAALRSRRSSAAGYTAEQLFSKQLPQQQQPAYVQPESIRKQRLAVLPRIDITAEVWHAALPAVQTSA